MMGGKFANIVDVISENKIFIIKHNTKSFRSFRWVSLNVKESDRKRGKVLYPLPFMPYKRNSVLSELSLSFVGSHPVPNRDKALL